MEVNFECVYNATEYLNNIGDTLEEDDSVTAKKVVDLYMNGVIKVGMEEKARTNGVMLSKSYHSRIIVTL